MKPGSDQIQEIGIFQFSIVLKTIAGISEERDEIELDEVPPEQEHFYAAKSFFYTLILKIRFFSGAAQEVNKYHAGYSKE